MLSLLSSLVALNVIIISSGAKQSRIECCFLLCELTHWHNASKWERAPTQTFLGQCEKRLKCVFESLCEGSNSLSLEFLIKQRFKAKTNMVLYLRMAIQESRTSHDECKCTFTRQSLAWGCQSDPAPLQPAYKDKIMICIVRGTQHHANCSKPNTTGC